MQVFYNASSFTDKIQSSINKFGCEPESNLFYYLNYKSKKNELVLFDFGDDCIALAEFSKSSGTWSLMPASILSPESCKLNILLDFINYCLMEAKGKKVYVEIKEALYKDLKEKYKTAAFNLNISKINCTYYWPVIDLELWDSSLSSSFWYRLRKIKNQFYRRNLVKTVLAVDSPKKELKNIVSEWKNLRKGKDKCYNRLYLNFIDDNFSGTDFATVIYVNDKPSSITAGWKIQNTNSFYLSILLHNYCVTGLGEISYLECLNKLKDAGYKSVDLGGSYKNLLLFKEKFNPHSIYKTVEFSIVKV